MEENEDASQAFNFLRILFGPKGELADGVVADGNGAKLKHPAQLDSSRPSGARSALSSPAPDEKSAPIKVGEFLARCPGLECEWLPKMQLGEAGERSEQVVTAKAGHIGHIVYGPYYNLSPGEYRGRVGIRRSPSLRPFAEGTVDAILRLEFSVVSVGRVERVLSKFVFLANSPPPPEVDLFFSVASDIGDQKVEARVWTSGGFDVTVHSVSVMRLGSLASLPENDASTSLTGEGCDS